MIDKDQTAQAVLTPFEELIIAKWAEGKRVCLGLDPDWDKFPKDFRKRFEDQKGSSDNKVHATREFLERVIDATHTHVLAYKPNIAFYYALGFVNGAVLLAHIIRYIKAVAPTVPIILDWKVGDIGNTNRGYLSVIQELGVHAFTVSPYLGMEDGIDVLLSDATKYAFVLCLTSNKGSRDIQEKQVGAAPIYMEVASLLNDSEKRNIGLVTGATKAEFLGDIRQEAANYQIFLLPGVGAQQGEVNQAINEAQNIEGQGFVVNVSRAALYCTEEEQFEPHVVEQIKKYTDQIDQALNFSKVEL